MTVVGTMVTPVLQRPVPEEGYSRRCPICGELWPSAKLVLRCWYGHRGSEIERMTTPQIAEILDVSEVTVQRAWRFLQRTVSAPHRPQPRMESPAYQRVVQYMRHRRRYKRGLPHGWLTRLAEDLGLSRQRISQLARRAQERGDA